MGITCTPIENPKQWHALRRGVVGASEAGALCGVHEYQTYYGLWARKAGKIPDAEDNPAMERGRRLEKVAVEMIRERFPSCGGESSAPLGLATLPVPISKSWVLASDPSKRVAM